MAIAHISGQEWQFHIASGQEWQFHIATDI